MTENKLNLINWKGYNILERKTIYIIKGDKYEKFNTKYVSGKYLYNKLS